MVLAICAWLCSDTILNWVRAIISGARSCRFPRFCRSGWVTLKFRPVEILGLKKLKALLDELRMALKLALTVGPSANTWL